MELATPPVGDWTDEKYKTAGRIHNGNYMSPDPELARQAQVGYYACITHLDHQIGRLMDALNEDGSLSDTFIMFISDHGELLGDHHLFRKALPYEGSARIPLIIRPHSGFDMKRGIISDDIAELRDVMPTLLDIAGTATPESADGVSLVNAVRGESGIREYLHGEHTYGNLSNHYIVTGHDKYIWFSQTGKEQYFDMDSDPFELVDKINAAGYQERINKLRNWLIAELDGRIEGYSDGENLIIKCNQSRV
jgi:arylsulfatase A-like enzyme